MVEIVLGIVSFGLLFAAFFVAGTGGSFVRRGWLLIPAGALFPLTPIALGAADDGESIALLAAWTVFWPALVALGYATGAWAQRATSRSASTC